MKLTILDCTNYAQLAIDRDETMEGARIHWENDGMTRVWGLVELEDSASMKALSALCEMSQFNLELRRALLEVFEAGRRFERAYPNGRGSLVDPEARAAFQGLTSV
jgi:hypothetical protein